MVPPHGRPTEGRGGFRFAGVRRSLANRGCDPMRGVTSAPCVRGLSIKILDDCQPPSCIFVIFIGIFEAYFGVF